MDERASVNGWRVGGKIPEWKRVFQRVGRRYVPGEVQRVIDDPEFKTLFPDAKLTRGGRAIQFYSDAQLAEMRQYDPNTPTDVDVVW